MRFLNLLQVERSVTLWDDTQIEPGIDWLAKIEAELAGASIAVLLISVDFLNSEFIRGKEVPTILERRSTEGLVVFPILIKPCPWQIVDWLKKMQLCSTLPEGAETLNDWELSRIVLKINKYLYPSAPASGTSVNASYQAEALPPYR